MALPSTTLRDFGGGWNVADSDLNLKTNYQPVSDNVDRGIDGSLFPRQGMALVYDFETGEATTHTASLQFDTTNLSPKIKIKTPAAHGLASGDHVTFTNAPAIGGITSDAINRTHGVLLLDADEFYIYVTEAATSTATVTQSTTYVTDDHIIGGNIIHDMYFNRRLIVFTDIGEIGTAEDAGTLTRIWGVAEAEALSAGLVPSRACLHWSSDAFKSTVIACNGYDRDKPVQIDKDFKCEYLIDKATLSNSAVPRADYVLCMGGYVSFIRTEYGDPFVEFSARGTDGTFTREVDPADAAEIDLSMITSSVEPVLLGAGKLRERMYCAFYDNGMLGTLGVYDESGNHQPDFKDTISENGTVSHRTIVSLGNDVIMCDYAGVPSVSISQQSGIFVPTRLSELIAPAIQQHLANMAEDTLRTKAFAVFNRSNKSYMLFVPIYDEVEYTCVNDPFVFNDDLRGLNYALLRVPQHRLFESSSITIQGATDIGSLGAADINGVRRVVSVVDKDNVIVELGGHPSNPDDTFGGGAAVTYTPVNDETICYVFEYNKEFKIRRWTRYRGWNFDCGCSSQRGRMYLAKALRVYRVGDNEEPIYADFVNDYTIPAWENSTPYSVGDRVPDLSDGSVYICAIAHTSPASGTFKQYRDANLDIWEAFLGLPINWAVETPWSSLQDRGKVKTNKYVSIDSEGTDRFTLSAFTNKIRHSPTTNELIPYSSLEFQAGDTGGFGIQNPGTWGSGRRTREEKVWPFGVRGKLIRWRFSGSTIRRVRIVSLTMFYMLGNIR